MMNDAHESAIPDDTMRCRLLKTLYARLKDPKSYWFRNTAKDKPHGCANTIVMSSMIQICWRINERLILVSCKLMSIWKSLCLLFIRAQSHLVDTESFHVSPIITAVPDTLKFVILLICVGRWRHSIVSRITLVINKAIR